MVRDFTMYNSSSFDYSINGEVSSSICITTLSARYKRIILITCIWICLQSFTSMVVSFSSHKRASTNPCWMSTSFTLTYHKEKLFFLSNLLISILIVLVFSIFYLDHHRRNLCSGTNLLCRIGTIWSSMKKEEIKQET